MKKFNDESRKLIDFDQKRKTLAHSKFETELDTSGRFREASSQSDCFLKRIILLEQRTRDYDELQYQCQNQDRKLQELDRKYSSICNWIQTNEQDHSIITQIKERVVDLEQDVKRIFLAINKLDQQKNDNFEAVIQNDLNTLYDIIKRHEAKFKDMSENRKQQKQEYQIIHASQSRIVSPKTGARQSCEINEDSPTSRDTFDPKFNNPEYLKRAKSLLNFHQNQLNNSIEKPSRGNYDSISKRVNDYDQQQQYTMNKSIARKDSDDQMSSRDPIQNENAFSYPLTEKTNESIMKWNNQNQGKLKKQLDTTKGSFVSANERLMRQQQTRKKDSGAIQQQPIKSYKL